MKCRLRVLSFALAVLVLGSARTNADILAVENGVPDVLRFTPGGTQSVFTTANLDYPIGINVDSATNVYVVDQGVSITSPFPNSVSRYLPNGTPFPTGTASGAPPGFFITPNTAAPPPGDPGGTPVSPGNTLNAPFDIAFDGSGKAYVTSGANDVRFPSALGYIAQYDSAGKFLSAFGLPDANVPSGIGYNPISHLLYVVNSASAGAPGPNVNSFLIYDPNNTAAAPTVITPTGAGALDGGQQVAFDGAGHVFIASNGTVGGIARIQEYDANGNYITTVATVPTGNAEGVAYDPLTNTLYASFLGGGGNPTATSGFIEKYAFNGTSFGAGVLVADSLNLPAYLVFQPVPEPGSVVLMGLGLVALAGYGVRRHRGEAGRAA